MYASRDNFAPVNLYNFPTSQTTSLNIDLKISFIFFLYKGGGLKVPLGCFNFDSNVDL